MTSKCFKLWEQVCSSSQPLACCRMPRSNLSSIGSFGRVWLVKRKSDGEYYALKMLKKSEIIKLKQVDHVISEYEILKQIKHPFLVSFCTSKSKLGLTIWAVLIFNRTSTNLWIGWPRRLCIGWKVPLFPARVHSRRRTLHLSSDWRHYRAWQRSLLCELSDAHVWEPPFKEHCILRPKTREPPSWSKWLLKAHRLWFC